MGTIIIWAIGILMMAIGILGCFIHRFPGPILTYLGILEIQFVGGVDLFSTQALIICALAVVLAKVLEKYIPKVASAIHEVSSRGKWGCVIGSVLGLLLLANVVDGETGNFAVILWLICCFVLLPFAVTYLMELPKKMGAHETLMAATAACATFLMGTILKLGVCIYCIYAVVNVH